jgi:hypothetical protein
MFNTISIDGKIKDFELDIGLHYEVAGKIRADAHPVESETARTRLEFFTEKVPLEELSDFAKPVKKVDETKAYWVFSDAKGKL